MKVKIFNLQGTLDGNNKGMEEEINSFLESEPSIHYVTQSSMVWNFLVHTVLTVFYEDRPAAREKFPS